MRTYHNHVTAVRYTMDNIVRGVLYYPWVHEYGHAALSVTKIIGLFRAGIRPIQGRNKTGLFRGGIRLI